MPNAPISQLSALTGVTNVSVLPIVSSGVTYKISYDTLINSDNILTRNKLIAQSGYTITFSGNSKLSIIESFEQGTANDAIGSFSYAAGSNTISAGFASHSEGNDTSAYGDYAHSEGTSTNAGAEASHAEGYETETIGYGSHAEGYQTKTFGEYSHAEGMGTRAYGDGQTVVGTYNTTGNTSSLFIVGNGSDDSNRSDLVLFDTSGVTINGNLTVTGTTNILPYRAYAAMVTQTAATNPSVTVLYNNTGVNFTWTRTNSGIFDVTPSSSIDITKTSFSGEFQFLVGPGSSFGLVIRRNISTNSNLVISVAQLGGGAPLDGVLFSNFVEIRIYN